MEHVLNHALSCRGRSSRLIHASPTLPITRGAVCELQVKYSTLAEFKHPRPLPTNWLALHPASNYDVRWRQRLMHTCSQQQQGESVFGSQHNTTTQMAQTPTHACSSVAIECVPGHWGGQACLPIRRTKKTARSSATWSAHTNRHRCRHPCHPPGSYPLLRAGGVVLHQHKPHRNVVEKAQQVVLQRHVRRHLMPTPSGELALGQPWRRWLPLLPLLPKM